MKKFFSIIFSLIAICFSFYYTHLASIIIKNNDPIMQQIKVSESYYFEESVNAEVLDGYIIPGISGRVVNEDKSYESMKKYGTYNEDLMVFDEVIPSISIETIYNKYISKSNPNNMMVSLVFLIRDYSYITEILNILDSKMVKATFFIDTNIIDESLDVLKLINNSNHQIEVFFNDYKDIQKYKKIIKKNNNYDIRFCLVNNNDEFILNNCSKYNMHTILPSIITSNYPYSSVKESLESGSIILLNNNEIVLRELPSIINLIKQKGYNLSTLNDSVVE